MKIMLDYMGKDENELNEKGSRISAALIRKDTYLKALAHQIEYLKEISQMLVRENENLRFANQEIITLPINHLRPKETNKAIKLLMKDLKANYVGTGIQMESILSSMRVK